MPPSSTPTARRWSTRARRRRGALRAAGGEGGATSSACASWRTRTRRRYALGIHPLYVDRGRRRRPAASARRAARASRRPAPGGGGRDRAGPLRAGAGPATAGALLPGAAGLARDAGLPVDPARAALGRCVAAGLAAHRRCAAASPMPSTAARLQAEAFVALRLQARLRRRDDASSARCRSAAWRPRCPTRRSCWRPTRPTSRRSGCTAVRSSARDGAALRATSRPSCRASRRRWPRCAAGRWSRRRRSPRPTPAPRCRGCGP